MLLSTTEFLDCGLPVASDISTDDVQMAITTIEHFYVKPRLGDKNYTELLSNPTDETNAILLSGGAIDDVYYAGIKKAECYLVFAFMMVNNYRVTRYSTVEKNSEYSSTVSRENLQDMAKMNWEIGEQFFREIMSYYDIEPDLTLPNIFSTLF